MTRQFKPDRPIAFIDLETTGLATNEAHIVEIAVCKIMPDGERIIKSRKIKPPIPIPPETTAIHGISGSFGSVS